MLHESNGAIPAPAHPATLLSSIPLEHPQAASLDLLDNIAGIFAQTNADQPAAMPPPSTAHRSLSLLCAGPISRGAHTSS